MIFVGSFFYNFTTSHRQSTTSFYVMYKSVVVEK